MVNPMVNPAELGGVFFLLSFAHFVVDWGFQSHAEAMAKSQNHKVRARHCTIYTIGMAPLVYLLGLTQTQFFFSLFILWVSHFLIDTYIPVYMWAKHIRRPPTLHRGSLSETSELERFKDFAQTTLGLVLMITMDQTYHLLFLIPIAGFAVTPQPQLWYLASGLWLSALLALTLVGAKKLGHKT